MSESLADLLATAIERINTGDDFAELYAGVANYDYVAEDSIQKDLRRLQQVFIDNPHFDDMLYLAAFTRTEGSDDEIYTRARFTSGHS